MIDDHPPIIEGYKSILSFNPHGYILETTEAYSCETAYKAIIDVEHPFDIIFLDLNLPAFPEKKINSGDDLIPLIRRHHANAKIVVLTSHTEFLSLFKVLDEYKPEGFLVKSDFKSHELLTAFHELVQGNKYYSATVIGHQKQWDERNKVMDSYNRQILLLLSQGVKTKNLPGLLHLSKSAIDKRKAIIKQIFGIDKGTDEDILKEARKQKLI